MDCHKEDRFKGIRYINDEWKEFTSCSEKQTKITRKMPFIHKNKY